MSKGFNEARCALLAKREGVSFYEAAKMLGRAGARKRREKRAQEINARCEARQPKRLPWWLQDAF